MRLPLGKTPSCVVVIQNLNIKVSYQDGKYSLPLLVVQPVYRAHIKVATFSSNGSYF